MSDECLVLTKEEEDVDEIILILKGRFLADQLWNLP